MTRVRTLALVFLIALTLGADWPQLLGPQRDGVSAETGLIAKFGPRGPEVAWECEAGEGFASPVVAGDKLILFHRQAGQEVVACREAKTGKEMWQFAYATTYSDPYRKGNGPRSTPVVAGGKVFTVGAGGELHCVDLKSGKKLWAKSLLFDYTVEPSFFGVGSTPIVEGKAVLLNVGAADGGVVGLDVETGKELWKATKDEASYSSPVAATLGGVRQVLFFTRTGLVAIDPAKGSALYTKRWRSRNNLSVNAAMPVALPDDHVFLTASYQTGAALLKVTKGRADVVWSNDKSLSSHFGTPVVVGEQLYGFDGRQEEGARLRCIDWKTGKVRWTEEGYGCGTLVAADGKLFVLSEKGELAILTATGDRYDELARAQVLRGPCLGHLALANGLLYARDERKLVCWKVK